MKLSHIEHIGIAVKDLKASIKFFEEVLGLHCYKIEIINEQKVTTAFFQLQSTKIELLEPIDREGPIAKFIEKRGEGIHHIAFAVDDIYNSLREIESKGLQLIDKQPRQGAEKMKAAFIHPKSTGGILIEFCEQIF